MTPAPRRVPPRLVDLAPRQSRPRRRPTATAVRTAVRAAVRAVLLIGAMVAVIALAYFCMWVAVDRRSWVPYVVSALIGGPTLVCLCCWYRAASARRPR